MIKKIYLLVALILTINLVQSQQCENLVLDDVQMTCDDDQVTLTPVFLDTQFKSTRAYTINGPLPCPLPTFDSTPPIGIVADDDWSFDIGLTFNFCFFENQYDQIVVSDNGKVSFDLTLEEGQFDPWNVEEFYVLPTQEIQTNAIFAPFVDNLTNVDPDPGSAISFGLLNQFDPGNRIFVINWDTPQFSCNSLRTRSRVMLYETSNVIDIIIFEKPICNTWPNGNEGAAIVGIQNKSGTVGYSPFNRGVFDESNMPATQFHTWTPGDADSPNFDPNLGELFRFVPDGQDTTEYSFAWFKEDDNGIFQFFSGDETITISPEEEESYQFDLTFQSVCDDAPTTLSVFSTVTPGFTPDIQNPIDLFACEDPTGSGTANFDIDQTTFVLNSLDPADFIISYHNSVDDANNNVDPITVLNPYNSSGETIYIRLEDVNDPTCVTIRSFILTVEIFQDATFSYDLSYCILDAIAIPNNIVTPGGVFTINNGGVINATTGEINLTNSGVGNFIVTYTFETNCPTSNDFEITIEAETDSSFTYPLNACILDANPLPITIATAGGTFSVDGGATIDPTTGELDISSTTIQTNYTITYSISGLCASFTNQTIEIVGQDDSTFNYTDALYCNDDANPIPNDVVTADGTFTITNGGTINAITGEVDIVASGLGTDLTGNFTITYQTSSSCSSSSTFDITIELILDASFVYANSVCIDEVNPLPSNITTNGGVFTIDNGGTIDPATGELDLTATAIGNYNITYSFSSGNCPSETTQAIAVVTEDDSTFNYSETIYCIDDTTNPIPNITGQTSGSFVINNGGVINPTTGEVDLSASGLGTDFSGDFEITYTTQNPCSTFTTENITIISVIFDSLLTDQTACDNYTLPNLSPGNYFTQTNGGGTQLSPGDVISSTQTIYVFNESNTTPNCTNQYTFTVTINNTPVAVAPADVSICDSYTLPTLSVGNYFTQTNGGGNALSAGDTITSSQTVFVFAQTATNPNCTNEDSFTITINTITAQTLNDVSDCAEYVLPVLNANNNYYTGQNGSGTQLNAGDVINTTQMIYIYAESVTTPVCTDQSSFIFTLYDTPTANTPTSLTECNNGDGTANFDVFNTIDEINSTETVTFHPTENDAINNTSQMASSPFLVASGNVFARVENADGCFVTVEVSLTVDQCFLVFPEGFSPNSPIAQNTTFNIVGLNGTSNNMFPNYEMYIYNRYGKEVYFGNSSKSPWNGKVNNDGEELPAGTYFFGLYLNDEQKVTHRGWVYLQR